MRKHISLNRILPCLLLPLCLLPAGTALSQVVMTPPVRSVEMEWKGVVFTLPEGTARDDDRVLRLFGDAKARPETRVVQHALQLLPQAGLSWTASDPMVSLSVAKYYLALGDEIRVPFFLLANLPATGGMDVDNTVTNLLDEYGGLLNLSLGVENTRLTAGKLFAFTDPNEGLFFEARLGMKLLGVPDAETVDTRLAAMGQALASLRGHFPVFAADSTSRAGELTVLLSLSAQYCSAERFRMMFADPLSAFQANLNLSGAVHIVRQLSLAAGVSLWASETRFDRHWFATFTLLNE